MSFSSLTNYYFITLQYADIIIPRGADNEGKYFVLSCMLICLPRISGHKSYLF